MDTKIITKLQCPYCETSLRLVKGTPSFRSYTKHVQWGIVACSCDVFPILEGILFLKKEDGKNKQAVELLKEKKKYEALMAVFEERRRAKIPYILFLLFWKKGILFPFSFVIFLLKIFVPENKLWFQHMLNRRRRPTFFLALSSLSYVKEGGVFVDIGCSMNWFFSLFFKKMKNTTFVGMDTSWSALFLAKKYTVTKEVNLICADVNHGLPFQKQTIDTLTINDTFMYIQKKKFLLQESLRVGKKAVHIFLSHVHNAGAENVGQGHGLTHTEVQKYLADFQVWFTSDRKLFLSLQNNTLQSYEKIKNQKFVFDKKSSSSSYILLRKNISFSPKKTVEWVYSRVKATQLDFKEDRFT